MFKYILLVAFFVGIGATSHDDSLTSRFYQSIDQYPCNPDIFPECSTNGLCIRNGNNSSEGYCLCTSGYITLVTNDTNNQGCNYKQRSQLVAFLLHFFLGTLGAGEFYLGNMGIASGQLVLLLGPILISCCLCCLYGMSTIVERDTNTTAGIVGIFSSCIACTISIAVFAWWLVDCIYIGLGIRLDGNGQKMDYW